MKITVIDYGAGNIKSVLKAFAFLGHLAQLSDSTAEIKSSDLLVFPGQGAFDQGMKALEQKKLVEPIQNHIRNGKPFLGICLGFQLLFESSEENGSHQGLGIFPGKIRVFPQSDLKIPQIGWNNLTVTSDPHGYFKGIENPYVYFVHSYYLEKTKEEIVSCKTDYGLSYVAAIQTPTVFATQFHPEKSGAAGLKILNNFLQSVSHGT